MSAPNPYNHQGQNQYPGQYGQQGHPPPARAQYDEDPIDAIPMKKSSPLTLIAILGGGALILGVAAFSFLGGKKPEKAPEAAVAAINTQAEESAKAKAMREHMEITQRSLAQLKEAEQPAAKAEPAPAAAPAEPAAAEPESAPAPAARPAQHHAQASAPSKPRPTAVAAEPKPAKKPSKKSMDSLDELGAGISTALGK